MTDYLGKNAYLTWIHSGGTEVLTADFRAINTDESIGFADITAGADEDRTFLTTVKEGSLAYSALHQSVGTALKQSLEAGNSGTLIFSPEGTATDKPKETYLAISQGAKMNYPYDNAVEVSCDFTKNGAREDSVW